MPTPKKHWRAFPSALPAALLLVVGCGGPTSPSADSAAPNSAASNAANTNSASSNATDPVAAEDTPTDVTAAEVLKRLAAAYRDAESYFDNAEYRETFFRQGEDRPMEPPGHQVSVAFERPNRVRIARFVPGVADSALEALVATDGNTLTATTSDLPGQYLETTAPEQLSVETIAADPVLREAVFPVPLANLYPQLDLLLATDDRPPQLLADADAKLLASREIDGAMCYRVAILRPGEKHVLWIDEKTSVLRRVDVPTERLRRQLDPHGVMLDWRLWIDLRDATIGGTIDRSVFQLAAPEGAESVDRFAAPKKPASPSGEPSASQP